MGDTLKPVGKSKKSAVARSIATITAEINFYKAQTVQNILEIGKRLIEAKERLPHGEWGGWLKDEVQLGERTAQNLIKLADEFSNPQALADLNYTKLVALLAVPEDDRAAFIAVPHAVGGTEKTVSEMTTRELEAVIKERDAAQLAAKAAEEKTDLLRQQSKHNYDSYLQAMDELEQERDTHEQAQSSLEIELNMLRRQKQEATAVPVVAGPYSDAAEALSEAIPAELTTTAAKAFTDTLAAAYSAFEQVAYVSSPQWLATLLGGCVDVCEDVSRQLRVLQDRAENLAQADGDGLQLPDED